MDTGVLITALGWLGFFSTLILFFVGRTRNAHLAESLSAIRAQEEELKTRLTSLMDETQRLNESLAEQREGVLESSTALAAADARIEAMAPVIQAAEEKAKELNALREAFAQQQTRLAEKGNRITELEITLEQESARHREKLIVLEQAKENLSAEFERIANKLFEEKSKKFSEQNQAGLTQLLNPLQENIEKFRKRVEETYEKGTRDHVALRTQITELTRLNQQVSEEANRLVHALKGESQTQGAWGEMILQAVLERSGLTEGREYTTQESITTDEGKRYRPDVIVHLPDQRDIIIDAKVSLTAYERYYNAADSTEQAIALKEHVTSLQTHIKGLSSKSYHELEGVRSLDYVLLFVPIESAFSLAIQSEPNLMASALEKNVIMVTPSTLLLALRTVENLWRYERQNRNAVEIARRAGALYDKFLGFVNDLKKAGELIQRAQKANDDALSKLHTGRGNLVNTAQALKAMGAKTQKQLDDELVEKAKQAELVELQPPEESAPADTSS